MLLDSETLALAAAIEPIIAAEHERGPAKRELMQCQAELATRPCRTAAELRDELDRLARRFKVSTLVILRRIHDAGGLSREAFWQAYEEELEEED